MARLGIFDIIKLMIITWLGQACFKIQSGDLVIAVDPYSKEIGLTAPRFRADILLVTHEHYDHANVDSIPAGALVIKGPGEYESKGVYIKGIETFHDNSQGKERGLNTIYKIELEDIRIAHLGDFGEKSMRDETLEEVGSVDILMIPVGGKYTIDGEEAAKIVKQIEPRFVIPMHYKIPGLKIGLDGAENFLKEMGAGKNQPQEKLVVKKKDFAEEEKTEVVALRPV